METPRNLFKAALRAGRHQIGIWNGIGGNTVAEALASCGYEWILIDTEHGPMDTLAVLPALQAIAGYPASPPWCVRPRAIPRRSGDCWISGRRA